MRSLSGGVKILQNQHVCLKERSTKWPGVINAARMQCMCVTTVDIGCAKVVAQELGSAPTSRVFLERKSSAQAAESSRLLPYEGGRATGALR